VTHMHDLKVEATAEVEWGPDPADIETVADEIGPMLPEEADVQAAARAAVIALHEAGRL
jgi:hypothetical protein